MDQLSADPEARNNMKSTQKFMSTAAGMPHVFRGLASIINSMPVCALNEGITRQRRPFHADGSVLETQDIEIVTKYFVYSVPVGPISHFTFGILLIPICEQSLP
jgi:hypothetical protein